MKNHEAINKYKTIARILENDRLGEVSVLSRLQKTLLDKKTTLERITKYRSDYENDNVAKLSKTVPALMINMIEFLNKLDITIRDEQQNVEKLNHEIDQVRARVDEFDCKLKAINTKIANLINEAKILDENIEANAIDEMVSITKLRD